MVPLLIALQLLTRLPIRLPGPADDRQMGQSLLWYPLVGALIGGLLLSAVWLLAGLPTAVAAALVLLLWVAITGALHLDGLADSADAWLGGYGDAQRTLRIMQDPACGPAGVVVLLLLLLLKFTTLEVLLEADTLSPLLLAPLVGRLMLVWLFLTTPYVRHGGLGSRMVNALPREASWWLALLGTLLLGFVVGLLTLIGLILLFCLLRRWMLQRIGGTTGDTAGALVEIVETSVLLLALN